MGPCSVSEVFVCLSLDFLTRWIIEITESVPDRLGQRSERSFLLVWITCNTDPIIFLISVVYIYLSSMINNYLHNCVPPPTKVKGFCFLFIFLDHFIFIFYSSLLTTSRLVFTFASLNSMFKPKLKGPSTPCFSLESWTCWCQ